MVRDIYFILSPHAPDINDHFSMIAHQDKSILIIHPSNFLPFVYNVEKFSKRDNVPFNLVHIYDVSFFPGIGLIRNVSERICWN